MWLLTKHHYDIVQIVCTEVCKGSGTIQHFCETARWRMICGHIRLSMLIYTNNYYSYSSIHWKGRQQMKDRTMVLNIYEGDTCSFAPHQHSIHRYRYAHSGLPLLSETFLASALLLNLPYRNKHNFTPCKTEATNHWYHSLLFHRPTRFFLVFRTWQIIISVILWISRWNILTVFAILRFAFGFLSHLACKWGQLSNFNSIMITTAGVTTPSIVLFQITGDCRRWGYCWTDLSRYCDALRICTLLCRWLGEICSQIRTKWCKRIVLCAITTGVLARTLTHTCLCTFYK